MQDDRYEPTATRRALLLGTAGLASLPLASLADAAGLLGEKEEQAQGGPWRLPPLPYSYRALEPTIDERTMRLHHGKHHAAYVQNLNEQVFTKHPQLANRTPEDLIRGLAQVPEEVREAVRNNGGGHVNHSMFWRLMSPRGGGRPSGPVGEAIRQTFGSFETFQEQFNDAGLKRFGSGWVWLVRDREGKLAIRTTANQDNPLMEGETPLLGNDVWEHAYYLKYQNRRADYLKAWWKVVNWAEVERRMDGGR